MLYDTHLHLLGIMGGGPMWFYDYCFGARGWREKKILILWLKNDPKWSKNVHFYPKFHIFFWLTRLKLFFYICEIFLEKIVRANLDFMTFIFVKIFWKKYWGQTLILWPLFRSKGGQKRGHKIIWDPPAKTHFCKKTWKNVKKIEKSEKKTILFD